MLALALHHVPARVVARGGLPASLGDRPAHADGHATFAQHRAERDPSSGNAADRVQEDRKIAARQGPHEIAEALGGVRIDHAFRGDPFCCNRARRQCPSPRRTSSAAASCARRSLSPSRARPHPRLGRRRHRSGQASTTQASGARQAARLRGHAGEDNGVEDDWARGCSTSVTPPTGSQVAAPMSASASAPTRHVGGLGVGAWSRRSGSAIHPAASEVPLSRAWSCPTSPAHPAAKTIR